MKQCFRIALWMFVLIGHLQARPVDLTWLTLLTNNVSCGDHVNFTSPTMVQTHCKDAAALEAIKEGLNRAKTECTASEIRINNSLEALERISVSSLPTNATDCKLESEASRVQFADFVKDSKLFIQNLNSQGAIKIN